MRPTPLRALRSLAPAAHASFALRAWQGKSGGYRVITFYGGGNVPVFLLNVFSKGDRVDLTQAKRNELRKELAGLAETIVSECAHVSKAGSRILGSVRKARAFARGETSEGFVVHVPDSIDVGAIRQKLRMSQEAFAQRFGFSAAAVRDWEQGRRQPERAARVLLLVIQEAPQTVEHGCNGLRAVNCVTYRGDA